MKIAHFTEGQGSEEWHLWRKNGIGASDIACVMGSNPYKTPLQLWEEKNGFRGPDPINPAIEHGIKNEPIAREWLNKHLGLKLEPLCIEDAEKSHYKASLDGYDGEQKVLVEIKCPLSSETINKAREDTYIPLYWQHQLQWQIMLGKPIRAMVAIWDYKSENCIIVEGYDDPTLQKEMREKADEFWRKVQMGTLPEPTDSDYIEIEDEELKVFLEEYERQGLIIKEAEEIKKVLREKIVDYGDDGNFIAYGFKVKRVSPRVCYDYKQMMLDGIDLEKYQKKSSGIGYYRITPPTRDV